MKRLNGHCILSHGFESGPEATKVTALAEVAERLGFSHERPDYTDLDARLDVSALGDVGARVQRLMALAEAAARRGPLVLAGSSLGAWISGAVSLRVPVRGLFLLAPPVRLDPEHPLQAAAVPTSIVHGWEDELIPASDVVHAVTDCYWCTIRTVWRRMCKRLRTPLRHCWRRCNGIFRQLCQGSGISAGR